ncbi:yeats domain [Anaeramoeba flamelloides]|uniref:Yeats domain n=1 Tax=Anaeramoeba flamelloides TaxID=1746091 RepID=A0ABQ8Z2S4_9EUKA|nr:yeats domain [Anaeramoeba flamelloides]
MVQTKDTSSSDSSPSDSSNSNSSNSSNSSGSSSEKQIENPNKEENEKKIEIQIASSDNDNEKEQEQEKEKEKEKESDNEKEQEKEKKQEEEKEKQKEKEVNRDKSNSDSEDNEESKSETDSDNDSNSGSDSDSDNDSDSDSDSDSDNDKGSDKESGSEGKSNNKEKSTKKKEKEKEAFVEVDPFDTTSFYMTQTFYELYKKKGKKEKSYEYDLFYLQHSLILKSDKPEEYMHRKLKEVANPYKEKMKLAQTISLKYVQLGRTSFQILIGTEAKQKSGTNKESGQGFVKGDLYLDKKLITIEDKEKKTIFKQKWKDLKFFIHNKKKKAIKIECTNSMKSIQFLTSNHKKRNVCILSLLFFYKWANEKNKIGWNPPVDVIDVERLDFSTLPPIEKDSTKSFNKYLVNYQSFVDSKKTLEEYYKFLYKVGTVNFWITLIKKHKYPFVCAKLMINHKKISIVREDGKKYKLYWKNKIKLYQNNKTKKLFLLSWENKKLKQDEEKKYRRRRNMIYERRRENIREEKEDEEKEEEKVIKEARSIIRKILLPSMQSFGPLIYSFIQLSTQSCIKSTL